MLITNQQILGSISYDGIAKRAELQSWRMQPNTQLDFCNTLSYLKDPHIKIRK